MQGGRHGDIETWRYIDAGLMMVRTTLVSKQISALWYLEEMAVPGKAVTCAGLLISEVILLCT